MKNIKFSSFFLFISISLFLIGVFVKLNVPLAEWDRVSFEAAINWSNGINFPWLFVHPPGYPIYLAFVFKIFGVSISVVRLANAFCLLLTGLIIYQLAKSLTNKNVALWSVSLYFVSPMVIQGSMSMDVADTSLLPLGYTLLAWSLVHSFRKSKAVLDITLITLFTAFCLWLKLTSMLVMLAGIFLYVLLNRKKIDKMWIKKILAGTFFGFLLFLITWIFISVLLWGKESCFGVLLNPVVELKAIKEGMGLLAKATRIGVDTIRIVFWCSPFFLFMVFWQILKILKNRKDFSSPLLALVWISSFYSIVYILIGGTNWGFPRYHAGILPILVIFAGILISDLIKKYSGKELLYLLSALCLLCLIYIFFLYDPLYFLILKWKESILFGNISAALLRAFLHTVLYLSLPLFVFLFSAKMSRLKVSKFKLFLLIGTLTTLFSLSIVQASADYNTAYQYGARGKEELVAKVLNIINKNDIVMASPEFIYEFREKEVPNIPWKVWQFIEVLSDTFWRTKPKILIMGLSVNSFEFWRDFLEHENLQFILDQEYKDFWIGTYRLWIRRNHEK